MNKLNTYSKGHYIAEKYRVIREPIWGGMGIVYIVEDVDIKQSSPDKVFTFALKSIGNETREPKFLDSFNDEVSTWIHLEKHPNIINAYSTFEFADRLYLLLEFVNSGNLHDKIHKTIMSEEQIFRYIIQLCNGMIYAYEKIGLLHMDLKPQNILFSEDDILKITDFGLSYSTYTKFSKKHGHEQVVLSSDMISETRTFVGTWPYASPEHFHSFEKCDTKSDIYSFGVILFEMISGNLPFLGKDFSEYKDKHCNDIPKSLTTFLLPQSRFCDRYNKIVQKCLAKEPDKRFENFRTLRDVLITSFADIFSCKYSKNAKTFIVDYEYESVKNDSQSYDLNADHVSLSDRGEALMKIQRYSESIKFIDRAISILPEKSYYWYLKGECYRNLDDFENATACFEKAFKLDYSDPRPKQGLLECSRQSVVNSEVVCDIVASRSCWPISTAIYDADFAYVLCYFNRELAIAGYLSLCEAMDKMFSPPCDVLLVLSYWQPSRLLPYSILAQVPYENSEIWGKECLANIPVFEDESATMRETGIKDYWYSSVPIVWKDYKRRKKIKFTEKDIDNESNILLDMGIGEVSPELAEPITMAFRYINNIEHNILLARPGVTFNMLGGDSFIVKREDGSHDYYQPENLWQSEEESRKHFLNNLYHQIQLIEKCDNSNIPQAIEENVIEYAKRVLSHFNYKPLEGK